MVPKSRFGHPGVRFLRFWEDLIEVRILMIFWTAPKVKKIWKKEAEVWKERSGPEGRRKTCAPRRAFGVCKVRRIRLSLQRVSDALSPASRGRRIVTPSGVPPTLFFQDLGLRTYAVVLVNKSKNDLFGLISGKVFLNPCLFFEGVVGANCCSGFFELDATSIMRKHFF